MRERTEGPQRIGVGELRANLASFVGRVQWGDERFFVFRHSDTVAGLVSWDDVALLERIDKEGIEALAAEERNLDDFDRIMRLPPGQRAQATAEYMMRIDREAQEEWDRETGAYIPGLA